jgi:hypothetical protein
MRAARLARGGLRCLVELDRLLWQHLRAQLGVGHQGKAQTAAMPGGIARICNAAMAQKARFHVGVLVKWGTKMPWLEQVPAITSTSEER